MNVYCQGTLHQMEVALTSILEIMDGLTEEDLQSRPTPSKHSIGELISHISLILRADFLISEGAGQKEMSDFYSCQSLTTLGEMKQELQRNFHYLKEQVAVLTDDMLTEEITSYWGVTYTRFEWLVEIVAHLYHHRGQLHAMLVHCCEHEPHVSLFE
ncbi:DinB family protein [Rossellomorea sp. NPDC077527]|uniref:DinB family protein n=1 Tax=Rossellomorea sp. NPDC077527 TaxID=3364510 RepID=UPI0037C7D49D